MDQVIQDFNVVMMDIDALLPYANNPRKNKKAIEPVKKSLKEYGFRQPIVVDEQMVVIVGHTRLQAAKELKLKQVPVHVAKGLTVKQIQAYRIADNKTAEFAVWDKDLLAMEMKGLEDLYTGFEDDTFVTELGTQTVEPTFEVIIVSVDGKTTQKDLFERLTKEGHKCRVVMV